MLPSEALESIANIENEFAFSSLIAKIGEDKWCLSALADLFHTLGPPQRDVNRLRAAANKLLQAGKDAVDAAYLDGQKRRRIAVIDRLIDMLGETPGELPPMTLGRVVACALVGALHEAFPSVEGRPFDPDADRWWIEIFGSTWADLIRESSEPNADTVMALIDPALWALKTKISKM